MAKPTAARKGRKKERKNIAFGVAHIKSSFNNTIVSITDPEGDVLALLLAGLAHCGGLGHYFVTFFLPATVRLGPLRVRALVRVR